MKHILPAILVILFAGFTAWESADKDIKLVRNYLAEINYDLLRNDLPPFTLIGSAGDAVTRLNNEDLKEKFLQFEKMYNTSPAVDTLRALLNILSDRFYLTYGETLYKNLTHSGNLKILLFKTSVSCECTLKQCAEYEHTFYEIIGSLPDKPEFLLSDTFYDERLGEKYGVTFVPVLLFLDQNNNEAGRFTREEDIKIKVDNFLAERD